MSRIRKPTVQECLHEIERLRAENARLTRLVQTQRPELDALRRIEVGLRDYLMQADRLVAIHAATKQLLPGNDDLPGLMELRGIMGDGRACIDAILDNGQVARPASDAKE